MIRSSVLAFVCLAVLGTPLGAASECYGPVGRDDTLWLIALRLRPDPSITPQRMMLALLEANPGAFGRDNVNALYAGSTLCLGPRDSIKTDELAAIAEVRRHNREWKSGRAPVDAGSHDPAPTPERPPAAGPGRDREQRGSLRLDHAVAAFESRLSQVEDRIEHLESGSRAAGAGPMQVAEELARLAKRVARIEGRIRVLAASLETESEAETAEHGAMEPMPTPAPQSHGAMEPMPTPAPQSYEAMEPMPTPAPQSHGAMEPMPTPAPQSHEAMEPMPTPAPQSHEAMEPMPTPAPQSHEAMEPMPTPAPQNREAAGPEPEPVPEDRDSDEDLSTEESVSARVATWLERVRELLKR